jgi:hypothetical protein
VILGTDEKDPEHQRNSKQADNPWDSHGYLLPAKEKPMISVEEAMAPGLP